jgi:hypothetical protein
MISPFFEQADTKAGEGRVGLGEGNCSLCLLSNCSHRKFTFLKLGEGEGRVRGR